MPPFRSAQSLAELSTYGLVKYLTTTWKGADNDATVSVLRRISYKYLQEALRILVRTERVTSTHINLLLDPRFHEFDFEGSGMAVFDSDAFLEQLYTTCNHLTVLCLPFHSRITVGAWRLMANQLPNLRRLDVSGTRCNNDTVIALAKYSPDLTELVIADTDITDAGLRALYDVTPGCLNLTKLDVSCCQVSTCAVGAALSHLRSLQELDTDYLCLVLDRLHMGYSRGQEVDQKDQHALQRASVTVLGERANHIWVVCSYCPELRELQILGDVYNDCLQALASLAHLQSLHLENEDLMVNRAALVTLLQTVGAGLQELTLVDFEAVVLWDILRHCRHLTNLGFFPVPLPVLSISKDTDSLETLSGLVKLDLALADITVYTFDERTLVQLLSHCTAMEKLRLERCPALTDIVIKQIAQINPWGNLQQVSLQRCHEVTKCGVEHLVNLSPVITRMYLGRCGQISYLEVAELEDKIEQNCWDFKLFLHN